MTSILYTLPDCPACSRAKELLNSLGEQYRVIEIDNPLLELGVIQLVGMLNAPILLRAGRGAFLLSKLKNVGFIPLKVKNG